jgi:adenine-specific DNA-methyltransferase
MANTPYGPNNPHPLSTLKTELVWEGKYDEYGNRREVDIAGSSLPLQKIETIDEPRSRAMVQGTLWEPEKAHRDDWRNSLIWGDNRLVMASLYKDFKGKIDLIYIDPPFDVGADFSMEVPIGNEKDTAQKDQSLLEMIAYRDMWGKGTDSYLHMMYERLSLMKGLLSEKGSIYVHCDWHISHFMRSILEDVFGSSSFRNEIIWKRTSAHSDSSMYGQNHDTIFFFAKGSNFTWNNPKIDYEEWYIDRYYRYKDSNGRRFMSGDLSASGLSGGGYSYTWKGIKGLWRCPETTMAKLDTENRIFYTENGIPRFKRYLDEMDGTPVQTLWDDIQPVVSWSPEGTGYGTQKPEGIVARILQASSNEGDLVADFFCGSGTTGCVAESLGRRWIMADLGRFAIHTSRKRLIEIQRKLHSEHKPYRSFDVYNLGRYERQWWQKERLLGADEEHRRIVLEFFKAEPIIQSPSPLLQGRKSGSFVHVDRIDSIFTRQEAQAVVKATSSAGGKEVFCLAWEFEMDLRIHCNALETEFGVKIKLIPIPREVMEKNRKSPPPFLEVATLEVKPVYHSEPDEKGKNKKTVRTVDIKLDRFLPSLAEVPSKELSALKDRAVKSGFDFIDFWAVDFDFHPGGPFNHHWQAFRTRKNRELPTISDLHYQYSKPGKHLVCIKVVDVFGVDTSITIEVDA